MGETVKGLVLAGGGARGSYQVGAYQALQEIGWRPDVITGTSVGCLNGALFVTGKVAQAAELWKSLDIHGVLEVPQGKSPEELGDFFLDVVRGGGLDLEAPFQEVYVLSNDRALYTGEPVTVVNGRSALPLRVLAEASGAELTWDWDTATASLNTRGATPPQADYSGEDLYWLSRIISAESKGEPLLGQIAVGNVVLNRVRAAQFPNTVKEVIFDSQYAVQFTPVANGTIYQEPTASAVLAAKMCLEGASVAGDSLYFFAPAVSAGSWITQNRDFYTVIGNHHFYR